MPKIMEIRDDANDNDGYALVTIRVSKQDKLFHTFIEAYRDNKVIHKIKIE